ncbi:MAG: ABC transporter permease subunit [Nitrospira sp.]|nr:ABC transporter permease subunit [Nitrospira sp.]MDD9860771.1 ABC transporter permease subunit [Nitrospira sp.]
MTPFHAMLAKELRCLGVSPVVYVVGAIFLFVSGLIAYLMVANAGQQAVRLLQIQNAYPPLNLNALVFRPLFYSLEFVLMFLLPVLTMRVLAEERKLLTFELLLTSPIGINEIISAKYMSVLLVYLGLLSLTGLTPLLLSFSSSFHWGGIATGYMALALQGGLFLACGVLASAMTDNQVVAAFLSFGIILVTGLIGEMGSVLGDTTIGHILSYLSFREHYDRLVRGLVEARDVVYYLSGIVLMLFTAHRVVDAHRWQ